MDLDDTLLAASTNIILVRNPVDMLASVRLPSMILPGQACMHVAPVWVGGRIHSWMHLRSVALERYLLRVC